MVFRGERATFDGRYYRVKDVINSPPPLQPGGPPILVGGNGEKKAMRLVAKCRRAPSSSRRAG